MTAIPVVFDTDIGTDADDALALALILASPELDLIGVTIVDGDVATRAAMAARLLGMAGRADIPVSMGEGSPIGPGRGPTWFGHEGRGLLELEWDGPEAPILDEPAPQWMVDTSRQVDYHLIAVGPFTNVARAVQLDPSLPGRTRGLTVMGGMADAANYTAEWQAFLTRTGLAPNHMDHNTASDLDAAVTMARAGFDMHWVTAEITFPTTLDRSAAEGFAATGSAFGDRLYRMLDIWAETFFRVIPRIDDVAKPFPADAVVALHDPLAVASVLGGPWLTMERRTFSFGTSNDLFDLTTVAAAEAEATQTASVAVDRDAFARFFTDRVARYLGGLPA